MVLGHASRARVGSFSLKGQIINIFGFAGTVLVTTTQLCHSHVEAMLQKMGVAVFELKIFFFGNTR